MANQPFAKGIRKGLLPSKKRMEIHTNDEPIGMDGAQL
jgi:hypothetical protein